MAAEYKKTIFMGLRKPSDKCLLVSLPMNMFRIQTQKFSSGLNFFQKAVLKLKYMPQLSNEKIAHILHLDLRLVDLIVDQLEVMGLITSTGYLTVKGKMARSDADGLIIDGSQRQIGYVFTYDKDSQVFPYYQKAVNFAEVNSKELLFSTENGTVSVDPPLDIFDVESDTVRIPNEETILQTIKNAAYLETENSGSNQDIGDGILQIKYIPDEKPESVFVCTYVYLPKIDDDKYQDDWLVLDPFGSGDNYELKLFLEKEKGINKEWANILFNTFKDANTENGLKYDESEQWFEQQVTERIVLLFNQDKYELMHPKIQMHLKSVVKSFMQMERRDFSRIIEENKYLFFGYMQETLEEILQKDRIDREEVYVDLDNNYGDFSCKDDRKRCLKQVYDKRILAETKIVPDVIFRIKSGSWHGKSLLDYLMKFIMSLSVEPNLEECNIIKVFKNRIETIIDVADQRNHVSHGRITDIDEDIPFGGDDAIEYFEFITNLINDYLTTL